MTAWPARQVRSPSTVTLTTPPQDREVGAGGADDLLRVDLDEMVVIVAPDPGWLDAKSLDELGRGGARLGGQRGEVELDPLVMAAGAQEPACGVETRLLARPQETRLPEDVAARQRGVAAELHLDGGGEPPQAVAVVPLHEERVSERFISEATLCIQLSSRDSGRMQTAAGLPAKGRSVKASTW